jgi:hypothetical protein
MASGNDEAKAHYELLRIFAYGNYNDFKGALRPFFALQLGSFFSLFPILVRARSQGRVPPQAIASSRDQVEAIDYCLSCR